MPRSAPARPGRRRLGPAFRYRQISVAIAALGRAFVLVKHAAGESSDVDCCSVNVVSFSCSRPDATLINRGPNICKSLKRLTSSSENTLFHRCGIKPTVPPRYAEDFLSGPGLPHNRHSPARAGSRIRARRKRRRFYVVPSHRPPAARPGVAAPPLSSVACGFRYGALSVDAPGNIATRERTLPLLGVSKAVSCGLVIDPPPL
jgi:hypothetical protein